MADNGRITAKNIDFTMIGNSALRDNRLDARTLGLYCRTYYYATIPNFKLYKGFLAKECNLGKDAFRTSWGILVDLGYIIQRKFNAEHGRFCYEYEVLAVPEPPQVVTDPAENADSSTGGNPAAEMAQVAEPTTNNTIDNNTVSNNNDSIYPTSEQGQSVPESVRKDRRYRKQLIVNQLNKRPSEEHTAILEEVNERYTEAGAQTVIQNHWNYYLRVLKDVVRNWKPNKESQTTVKSSSKSVNRFHNFQQREYNYDDLEKKLLAATW